MTSDGTMEQVCVLLFPAQKRLLSDHRPQRQGMLGRSLLNAFALKKSYWCSICFRKISAFHDSHTALFTVSVVFWSVSKPYESESFELPKQNVRIARVMPSCARKNVCEKLFLYSCSFKRSFNGEPLKTIIILTTTPYLVPIVSLHALKWIL